MNIEHPLCPTQAGTINVQMQNTGLLPRMGNTRLHYKEAHRHVCMCKTITQLHVLYMNHDQDCTCISYLQLEL